jgi:hypothetical protein
MNTTYAVWIDVEDVSARVWESIALTGGATVSTTQPQDVPARGYAVSLPLAEETHSPRGFSHNVVADYIRRHADRTMLPGIFVGAWWDAESDMIFLDLSMIFRDRGTAEAIGRESGQLAIWDFAARAEIRL